MLLARLRSLAAVPAFPLALGFGIFLWLMLPAGLIAFSDDFGYFNSIVEAVRRRRPWTDEWLEPWAASLSTLSALVYEATGSFQVAVHGVQVACAMIAAAGVWLLFRARGLAPREAALLALLPLSCPTLLWQMVDFTSMVVYVPCLLLAVWAADQRRWLFFVAVALTGVASRQSALAWILLPAFAVVAPTRNSTSRAARLHPAFACAGLIAGFGALAGLMNSTHSQAVITARLWERAQPDRALDTLLTGAVVWAVFTGLGALVFGWRAAGRPERRDARAWTLAALLLGAVIFSLVSVLPPVFAGHRSFDAQAGALYRNLLVAGGLAGWILVRFTIRWDFVLATLAGLGLVCLRSELWDYYLIEVGVLAFFGATPRLASETLPRRRYMSASAAVAVLAIGALHLRFAFEMKCQVDRARAACVLFEHALRDSQLGVVDLSTAPFGLIGWHLHRYYLAHEGQASADIGGFMRYLRAPGAELRQSPPRFWRDSRSLRPIDGPDHTRVVASGVFRVGWWRHQRFSVLRPLPDTAPPPLPFDRSAHRLRPFPLDDREWRAHIAGEL